MAWYVRNAGLNQLGPPRRYASILNGYHIRAALNPGSQERGASSIKGRALNSTKRRKVKITLPKLNLPPEVSE